MADEAELCSPLLLKHWLCDVLLDAVEKNKVLS